MTKLKSLALGAVFLFGIAGEAAADVGIWFGAENFRWREFDASGGQLLEESGPRYHVGANWRWPFGADKQTVLDVRGSIYLGQVDYDGQACTLGPPQVCTPFQTDTDYRGFEVGATVARRFGGQSGGEVFGGGGVDTWRRDVKGRGNVVGAIEDWETFYVVAGGGGYWNDSSRRLNARIGVKYPFYTDEFPDSYDVMLEPEGKPSLFVRLSSDFLTAGRPVWGIGAYYDTYRWDESDRERDGSIIIWQPESRQDVYGFYVTIYLP